MMRIAFFAVTLSVLLGAPRETRADEDREKRAVATFKDGVKYFKANKFDLAVEAFRKADELKPSWKLQYNIGQCEAALKRYGLAIEAFERYLGEGGDEVSRKRREEVLDELDQMRKMVGAIKVTGTEGVEIYVDKVRRGTTPVNSSILVTAGVEHWIWFVRDGTKLLSIKETISGGETLELEVPGSQPSAQPTTTPVGGEPEPMVSPAESAEPPPPAGEEPEKDKKGLSPVYFWVGAGATVVFGALTMAMALAADSKWEDLEKDEDPWSGNTSDDASDIRALQIVGYVSLGLTGAALIATGIFIPFTNWGNGEDGEKDVSWTLGPWGASECGGMSLNGRF